MTLSDFQSATRHLPPETIIHVVDPWGDITPASLLQREDLVEGDPALDTFPAHGIVLAEAADS